jgi:predicted RNA-binding Zn ribbon-like protein
MKDEKFNNLFLDGGTLAFDFINTVNTRKQPANRDYLENFEDVLKWGSKTNMLLPERIKVLSAEKALRPRLAKKALFQLIDTREILYELFKAIANNRKPDNTLAADFNRLLSDAFGDLKMEFYDRSIKIDLIDKKNLLSEPFKNVMKSAYDILTTEDFARIKECPGCGWIFLDKTKNGKRRWCNMKVCGSSDKASRYYYRKKGKRTTELSEETKNV